MNKTLSFKNQDRAENLVAIAFLIAVILYFISFAIFIYYEWHTKITEVEFKDGAGITFFAGVGRVIHRKLFKRDRG